MAEVTLADALQNIQTSSISKRKQGLADLKHVLRHNQSNSRVQALGNKTFLNIFQTLFQAALDARSKLGQTTAPASNSTLTNLLYEVASALRLSVEAGLKILRPSNSIRAVYDHIIGTIYLSSGAFCEPLALEYIKSLRTIFSYQPHVEQLAAEWDKLVDFCVGCLRNAQVEMTDDEGIADEATTSRATNGISYRFSGREPTSSQSIRTCIKLVAEESVVCLQLLTAVPNAPLRRRADSILWALIEYLRASSTGTRSNQDAFAAVNNVISSARTEKVNLIQNAISPLIRLIRQLWFPKSLAHTQMLTCILLLEPYLVCAIKQSSSLPLRTDLAALSQTIQAEHERDHISLKQLSLDDIRLEINVDKQILNGKVATSLFTLKCVGARAESNWLLVYVLAAIHQVLMPVSTSCAAVKPSSEEGDEIDSNPRQRKRQRVEDEFGLLLESTSSASASAKICALQVLSFILQRKQLSASQLLRVTDILSLRLNDDNGAVASWAFLASACCAVQSAPIPGNLTSPWSSAWQMASRALSSASSCRAAAYLLCILLRLRLVAQSDVVELIQTVTNAIDVSGPTVLSDASVMFLVAVLQVSQHINPGSSTRTAESIISWLSHNFSPSRTDDKSHTTASAAYEAQDISMLIFACLNFYPHSFERTSLQTWEDTARVWLHCQQSQDLVSYLLLQGFGTIDINPCLANTPKLLRTQGVSVTASCEDLLLTYMIAELTRTNDMWASLAKERFRTLGTDAFAMLCKVCCVVNCVASCGSFRDKRREEQLRRQADSLLKSLCGFTSDSCCDEVKADILLSTFSTTFSGLGARDGDIEHRASNCELTLCRAIVPAIHSRRAMRENNVDEDSIDMEEESSSQESRITQTSNGIVGHLNDLDVTFSRVALRSCTALYAKAMVSVAEEASSGTGTVSASSEMVDFLLDQAEVTILAGRDVIAALPTLGLHLTASDTERLLTFFIETKGMFTNNYAYARSEVARGAVLDVLCSQIQTWTDQSHRSLYRLGLDIYEWCTEVVLAGGFLSPKMQIRMATLFLKLSRINPNYTNASDSLAPSPRQGLFSLLSQGHISLLFYVAARISEIFDGSVLATHVATFEDLLATLPDDSDWTEGIAMRLLLLSTLASAWHSLLRYCVYYVFETAARISVSQRHASHCIDCLAKRLPLMSPKRLFTIFAPQLLYTYLDSNQSLSELPFAAFQYSSLSELLRVNASEACAQLVLRDSRDGLKILSKHTKLLPADIIRRSMSKCMAYSIGYDTSIGTGKADVEGRLRSMINGKEEARRLISEQYPVIMGYLYLTLRQDDPEDSWLAEHSLCHGAARALAEIKQYGYSAKALPACQQPSFKNKTFCEAVERLNRRTAMESKLWTVSQFTLIARMLVDSLDESLGSLHLCLTVRRMRVLICMAGDIAYHGFALEMLVHSLRPLIDDAECTEDTLGLLQYLFFHGQGYLRTRQEFLRGTVVLLVLQIQRHSAVKAERHAQESQLVAINQKLRNFQKWLVDYLVETFVGESVPLHSTLYTALECLQLPGNARKGTPESELLLFLLDQLSADIRFCSPPDTAEALSLLSNDFEAPSSVVDDCLGSDLVAVNYTNSLWRALRSVSLTEEFTVWASQVIGRAYASTGVRPAEPQQTSSKDQTTIRTAVAAGNIVAESQVMIARRVTELLYSRSRIEAGLAEFCLRSLYQMQRQDVEDAIAFEQFLPVEVLDVVKDGTFQYVPALENLPYTTNASVEELRIALDSLPLYTMEQWTSKVAMCLCAWARDVPHVTAFAPLLQHVPGLAAELLPCIVHILLSKEIGKVDPLRTELSSAFTLCLAQHDPAIHPKQRFILKLLLYLHSQRYPNEVTRVDRYRWLDCNHFLAAQAGAACGMPTYALLLAESDSTLSLLSSAGQNPKQSLTLTPEVVSARSCSTMPISELLFSIYKQVEEPDSFYGVSQPASLNSVLERFDHEADGFRSLMFRSAQLDSHLRSSGWRGNSPSSGLIRSLSNLNFNGLALALTGDGIGNAAKPTEEMMNAAQALQQWDFVPSMNNNTQKVILFETLQELSRVSNLQSSRRSVTSALITHTGQGVSSEKLHMPSHAWYGVLASLTEVHEIVSCANQEAVATRWRVMQDRTQWMQLARFEDAKPILLTRQTLFGILRRNNALRDSLRVDSARCSAFEAEALLENSRLARKHSRLQEALVATTSASDMLGQYSAIGLRVSAAVKHELASVIWDIGEASVSVRMLRDILELSDTEDQDILVGRAGVLAQLGHQLAEARLEKPEDILSKCLRPAIDHLQANSRGLEAGKVYYEFATFCDRELQNSVNIENLNRVAKLRRAKEEEIEATKAALTTARKSSDDRVQLQRSLNKAQQWLDIDSSEEKRLKGGRKGYVHQSLQNYLLALAASDRHNICVLRFFSLWLENAEDEEANEIALQYLKKVPSWKFVLLMNQLMSRAEQGRSTFQTALQGLLVRICGEHPHHSAHHLFAAARKPSESDLASTARYGAAHAIWKELRQDQRRKETNERIFKADTLYKSLAELVPKLPEKVTKFSTVNFRQSKEVATSVPELFLPPVTMSISLRTSMDYSDLPVVVRYESRCSVMTGNSAPKLATCIASDGRQYKQLFKSGDDLRQDAIMEQVFEEVSNMLQNHKATRQRDLKVRTYKVIPLSPKSGIIEFVPNSLPLNEFLRPAHRNYRPHDWTDSKCRDVIAKAAQTGSSEHRVKEYRAVCSHLHPVLRHFFFERFHEPDEWFEKRTAYTRTTASISILGHILGLGDRHNSNIMLDTKSGEVVHIDLGVAFEAGRILPIPELVPFRLTRDIVDGMGATGTEGVFRRCCEFTLDAVREDSGSIMTLLNVLRYDPLYSWTVSPLRAKRMQEALETGRNGGLNDDISSRKREQNAGEAERALSVVEKKLSKTLSTAAMVSELIQAATDEKHLATLFHGWAAYF